MKRLLLISSSRVHGSGYFEHAIDAIAQHLQGIDELLFVPYALADHNQYEETVARAFSRLDLSLESIHRTEDPVAAVLGAKAIFVGGGNTFRLLKSLYDLNLIEPILDVVGKGIPYMGSSAGTNLACPTIKTTNDMPIVQPPSFAALGLIPFQINPHFLDADPGSTHKGETREQRLGEYLEENVTPVLGIREGSWLRVSDDDCVLCGATGGVLFERGKPPLEVEPGASLSRLL